MRVFRWTLALAAVAAAAVTFACSTVVPAPASARVIPEGACKAIGAISGLGGKACDALSSPGSLLKAGKSLVTGHIGSAIQELLGSGGGSSALGLAAIVAWVYGGARAALHEMGKVVNETAAPQLGSVWFSSSYWRIASVAALLTLPFLFAAAVQALLRSDISLLARAAFGHLPLALVAVGIAAPMTMLLLSGTDELSALVWSPSSSNGLTNVLIGGGGVAGMVAVIGAPFLAFLLCLFEAAAALLVWLELAMREAAVYIVVLLLPLAFAALVWPARRVWAVRAVEILVALILSKFAIVAVLGLGGAALDHAGAHGLSAMLAGMVLVVLAALAPWAVLRLVPLTELASSAASGLRPHATSALQAAWPHRERREVAEQAIAGVAGHLADLVSFSTNGMRVSSAHGAAPQGQSRNGRARGAGRRGDGTLEAATGREDEKKSEGAVAGGMDFGDHADTAGVAHDDADAPGVAHDDGDAPGTAGEGHAPGVADAIGVAHREANVPGVADPFGVAHREANAPGNARSGARTDARTGDVEPVAPTGTGSAVGEERIPGADPMWQAPDMSWRPLPLGLEDEWPPELWPPEGDPVTAGIATGDVPDRRRPGPVGPAERSAEPGPSTDEGSGSEPNDASGGTIGTGEQRDPLPPAQERGGAL